MKKLICLLIISLFLPLALFSCQREEPIPEPFPSVVQILRIHDQSVLVDFGSSSSLGWATFGTRALSDIDATIGDFVEITWNGFARLISPASIDVLSWRLYERAELPTFTATIVEVTPVSCAFYVVPSTSVAGQDNMETVRLWSNLVSADYLVKGDVIEVVYTQFFTCMELGYTAAMVDFTILERGEIPTFIGTVSRVTSRDVYVIPSTSVDSRIINGEEVVLSSILVSADGLAVGDVIEVKYTQVLIRYNIPSVRLAGYTIIERAE